MFWAFSNKPCCLCGLLREFSQTHRHANCTNADRFVSFVEQMMYTTSLLPCAAAVMLMVNAMRLPGASVGILYMLWPDWEMLLDTKVGLSRCDMLPSDILC